MTLALTYSGRNDGAEMLKHNYKIGAGEGAGRGCHLPIDTPTRASAS
jgi:hypothetical protein